VTPEEDEHVPAFDLNGAVRPYPNLSLTPLSQAGGALHEPDSFLHSPTATLD